MGKRVLDDATLTALADRLRERSAMGGPFTFPGDFMASVNATYDEGHRLGRQQGHEEGISEGAAICAAKHFIHSFVGDGSDTAIFHTPFEPDQIQVCGFDPTILNCNYTVFGLQYDLRAFGQCVGFLQHTGTGGGINNVAFSARTAANRYSRAEDGMVTITGVGNSDRVVTFGAGFIYTVVAVKYTEQTDKERITDFVNRLTGNGTVSLQQGKVAAAFTDDEWAALIATKPGWTFTWI